MKSWKSIFALVTSLCLCAALAGCGKSDNDNSTINSSSSVMTENKIDDTPDLSAIEGTADSKAEEATEAPVEDNPLCAYYDLLAEEWEKTGNTSTIELVAGSNHSVAYHDGKAIFVVEKDDKCVLCHYDINAKKLTENEIDIYKKSGIYYRDGFIYTSSVGKVKKFDLEGNEIASIEQNVIDNGYESPIITDSGYIYCHMEGSGGRYFGINIISSDFSTVTPLPTLYGKDSHGLDTEISTYTAFASYGNKIYVVGLNNVNNTYDVYYFDCDTMTWSDSQFTLENQGDISRINNNGPYYITSVGKYCFVSGRKIYNMETNEIITGKLYDKFNQTYVGGNSSIVIKDGTFYSVQIPEETVYLDNFDFSGAVALGTDSNANDYNIYCLDDTYYIYEDEAGLFLRTYEKGDSEEEIVYAFNN